MGDHNEMVGQGRAEAVLYSPLVFHIASSHVLNCFAISLQLGAHIGASCYFAACYPCYSRKGLPPFSQYNVSQVSLIGRISDTGMH